MQAGRGIQGVADHKGKDPEEHRGEKGASDQLAARAQRHHAGIASVSVSFICFSVLYCPIELLSSV